MFRKLDLWLAKKYDYHNTRWVSEKHHIEIITIDGGKYLHTPHFRVKGNHYPMDYKTVCHERIKAKHPIKVDCGVYLDRHNIKSYKVVSENQKVPVRISQHRRLGLGELTILVWTGLMVITWVALQIYTWLQLDYKDPVKEAVAIAICTAFAVGFLGWLAAGMGNAVLSDWFARIQKATENSFNNEPVFYETIDLG